MTSGPPATAMPFVEFARFFAVSSARRNQEQRVYFAECLFLAAIVIVVVLIWRRSDAKIEWRFTWLGYMALFAILPHTIWIEDYGFLRIFADLFVVSAALIIASTSSARWVTLLMTAALWHHLAKYLIAAR